jgi:hypothetical protein
VCGTFSWWLNPLTKYDEMIKERRKLLKSHDYDVIPPEQWWEPNQRKNVAKVGDNE